MKHNFRCDLSFSYSGFKESLICHFLFSCHLVHYVAAYMTDSSFLLVWIILFNMCICICIRNILKTLNMSGTHRSIVALEKIILGDPRKISRSKAAAFAFYLSKTLSLWFWNFMLCSEYLFGKNSVCNGDRTNARFKNNLSSSSKMLSLAVCLPAPTFLVYFQLPSFTIK